MYGYVENDSFVTVEELRFLDNIQKTYFSTEKQKCLFVLLLRKPSENSYFSA